jgi:predicted PurR-regulated permease PerM/beta-phosphoglucomutase-like phosphatase (HAD superfamily)
MTSRRWTTATKIIVASAIALIGILLLVTFRQMIAPTVVAFLLTFVLSYPVNWLQQRTGWARTTAVIGVYLVTVVLLGLLLLLIIPRLDTVAATFRQTVEDIVARLQTTVGGPLLVVGPFRFSADTLFQQTGTVLQGLLGAVTNNPVSIVSSVASSVVSVVYVFVLNFWLLKDWYKFQRFTLDLIPADYQEEMRRLGSELSTIWQGFLRGQLLLGLVVGAITGIALFIVGMPNALGLAILAALMELLPSIGPMISGFVGFIVALVQGSNWLPVGNLIFAILVGIIYAIIGQIESVYFIPRFVGGRVKLHPAVTFAGIIAGAMTFGVLGILLAAPVIASARVLLTYAVRKITDQEPFELEVSGQTALHIPGVIAGRKIEAVIFDLDGTLTPIDRTLLEWAAAPRWLDRLLPPAARAALMRRLMIGLEGPINFFINLFWRWRWKGVSARLRPAFDRLRGQAAAADLVLAAGAGDVVHALADRYRLALVTSRDRADVEQFLALNNLGNGVFRTVVTRDDVKNILPHPEPLTKALSHLGVIPTETLVVGDTDVSLRAGRAAEMATAGVASGLAPAENLRDADLVLSGPDELLEWL